MREIRQYGSEGGAVQSGTVPTPIGKPDKAVTPDGRCLGVWRFGWLRVWPGSAGAFGELFPGKVINFSRANRRIVQIGFRRNQCAARGFDLFARGVNDGLVRFGGGSRLLAVARRNVTLFRQRGVPFGVHTRLSV